MDNEPRTCVICGASTADKRRDAMYCSGRCRKKGQRTGVATRRAPAYAVQVMPAVVPKRQRKPSVNDIAHLVLDASSIEASFRFASTRADYRFRAMCTRMADAIGAALDQEGLR